MNIYTEINKCREAVRAAQQNDNTVGLVLTMGALHDAHLSLIQESRKQCDVTAVTIYVNPTQFSPNEDFENYPKPLEKDLLACKQEGVDIVFTPDQLTMYGNDAKSIVQVQQLTEGLCGAHRPGHFEGVATIVTKLFNILPANKAFFGEKDYQQLVVIQQVVRDLNIPIEIIPCPTVRDSDGLAMSSRNVYLSESQRKQAISLSRSLFHARDKITSGEHQSSIIKADIQKEITSSGPVEIDYLEIVDAQTLEPMVTIDRKARICLAVHFGSCRLIDNIGVDV